MDSGRSVLAPMQKRGATTYKWGTRLSFGKKGDGREFLGRGWSAAEDTFTWTDGRRSEMVLPIQPTKAPVQLTAQLTPFIVPGKVTRQRVRVSANGNLAGEWFLTVAKSGEQKVTHQT